MQATPSTTAAEKRPSPSPFTSPIQAARQYLERQQSPERHPQQEHSYPASGSILNLADPRPIEGNLDLDAGAFENAGFHRTRLTDAALTNEGFLAFLDGDAADDLLDQADGFKGLHFLASEFLASEATGSASNGTIASGLVQPEPAGSATSAASLLSAPASLRPHQSLAAGSVIDSQPSSASQVLNQAQAFAAIETIAETYEAGAQPASIETQDSLYKQDDLGLHADEFSFPISAASPNPEAVRSAILRLRQQAQQAKGSESARSSPESHFVAPALALSPTATIAEGGAAFLAELESIKAFATLDEATLDVAGLLEEHLHPTYEVAPGTARSASVFAPDISLIAARPQNAPQSFSRVALDVWEEAAAEETILFDHPAGSSTATSAAYGDTAPAPVTTVSPLSTAIAIEMAISSKVIVQTAAQPHLDNDSAEVLAASQLTTAPGSNCLEPVSSDPQSASTAINSHSPASGDLAASPASAVCLPAVAPAVIRRPGTASISKSFLAGIPIAAQVPANPPLDHALPQTASGTTEAPSLAHDANNLIAALRLYSELLGFPGVLHFSHRHYAKDLKLLAARSTVLIERLLEFGTRPLPQSGTESQPQPAEVDITVSSGQFSELRGDLTGIADHPTPLIASASVQLAADVEDPTPTTVLLSAVQSAAPVEVVDSSNFAQGKQAVVDVAAPVLNLQSQTTSLEELNTLSSGVSSKPAALLPQISSNLVEVVNRWSSLLTTMAHGALTVNFGSQADLPIPVANDLIERILVNLVTNASSAIRERGAIRIGVRTLATIQVPSHSPTVVLTIDDSGCGMSSAQVERLLTGRREPQSNSVPTGELLLRESHRRRSYSDLDSIAAIDAFEAATPHQIRSQPSAVELANPRSARSNVRGLGLEIVREAVTQTHGKLFIQSREGRGTRIEIHWPALQTAAGRGTHAIVKHPEHNRELDHVQTAAAIQGIAEVVSRSLPDPGLRPVQSVRLIADPRAATAPNMYDKGAIAC